jgi:hypothetical protein
MVPPARGRGRKRPPILMKRSILVPHVDKVMTQVELPPFRGPRSPLDLVAIEIIFGCIFEAFRQMSPAAAAGAKPADDDKSLLKRRHQVMMAKKMQAPRYSCISLL